MLNRISLYSRQIRSKHSLRFTMANLEIKGQYVPTPLAKVVYGQGSVKQLPELLDSLNASKAYIVTGSSLQNKTPVIKEIEGILGQKHIKTFSKIAQHAPIQAIREAAEEAKKAGVDVFISVGGGSPIDSVKAIIHSLQKDSGGDFLPHIAIPTTLSVAETTGAAGYTSEQGHKIGVANIHLCPRIIIYDGDLANYTPLRLWLSSGMRALDHAIELLYNPKSSETPHRMLSLSTTHELFHLLPKSKANPEDADIRQRLQVVAFGTLFSTALGGGLGLSHSMGTSRGRRTGVDGVGHALGATYQIPHGITSCLTLSPVIRYKATTNPAEANQLARLAPFLAIPDGSDKEAAIGVADKVQQLVEELGLKSTLTEYKVPHTEKEMEAIAERALHTKEGDQFQAVVQIVKGIY